MDDNVTLKVKKPIQKRTVMAKNSKFKFYSDEEKKYYKQLPNFEQRIISDLEDQIDSCDDEIVPIRFKILQSSMSLKTKTIAMGLLDKLSTMLPYMGEFSKLNSYLSALCKIPFGVYKKLPIDITNKEDIKTFISNARNKMDNEIYGHKDAKKQITRLLAQWISNPLSKGLIIGIHGAMGTGKTSLVKDAICKTLDLPFAFVPLGGISDGSYLFGHSYTYEGSIWGKIVDILMLSKCMNPVIFFDELDKVSETKYGDEIINYLIHLTDQTQNDKISDKYFSNIEFDLSRCLIIFSYNNEESINPILRDRMICIHTKGYNKNDKIKIAREYMIPEILKEFNLSKTDIVFDDKILYNIIEFIEEEEGVRNFKRALYHIISNLNLNLMLGQEEFPVTVIDKHINMFIDTYKKEGTRFLPMYM